MRSRQEEVNNVQKGARRRWDRRGDMKIGRELRWMHRSDYNSAPEKLEVQKQLQ